MYNVRLLSHSLQSKAIAELNERPEFIPAELEELKAWLRQTPHLKARMDDQFLLAFLRGSSHNLSRAKEKIEMYYTCRASLPELMTNRDPLDPEILEVIRLGVGLPLPLTETSMSPRYILIRPGAYDATRYSIYQIMKVANMISDILLMEDDNLVITGEIGIVDFQNVTKSHLLQLEPLLVKKLAIMNQEGSPFKQKGIHYLHTPPGFDVVFNLFKNIMQSKNLSSEDHPLEIFIHPNTHETLYDHMSKKILPLEYGGLSGSLEAIIKFWEQKLISYREFFLDDAKYGTDESKRPIQFQHSQLLHQQCTSFD